MKTSDLFVCYDSNLYVCYDSNQSQQQWLNQWCPFGGGANIFNNFFWAVSGKVSVLQTCLVFAVCFSALALNEQVFFVLFFVTCPFHSCFTVNLLKILYNLKLYQIVYFKIVGHFELQSTETLFRFWISRRDFSKVKCVFLFYKALWKHSFVLFVIILTTQTVSQPMVFVWRRAGFLSRKGKCSGNLSYFLPLL